MKKSNSSTLKFAYSSLIILCCLFSFPVYGGNFTWTGAVDSLWDEPGNWDDGIEYYSEPPNPEDLVPGDGDTALIQVATYSPELVGDLTILALIMDGGAIDFEGFTLTVSNYLNINGGTLTNGILDCQGVAAIFTGATLNAEIIAECSLITFSNSEFDEPAEFTFNGDNSIMEGGNTFNRELTLRSLSGEVQMATVSGDVFNGNLELFSEGGSIALALAGTTYFNGDVIVNSTSGNGIYIGGLEGDAELSGGYVIAVGGSGFSTGTLLLTHFTQQSGLEQNITLTGDALLNLIGDKFEDQVEFTAPSILVKYSSFEGKSFFTTTGVSDISYNWEGGNTFKEAFHLTTGVNINMETNAGDFFGDSVIITTDNTGAAIYAALTGETTFNGSLFITGTDLVFFNTGDGSCLFTDSSDQKITAPYDLPFANLVVNKGDGNLILQTPVNISSTLNLTKGKLITDDVNMLTILASASCSGASNESFVNGPMKKIGSTSFKFDVGKGVEYNPIEISEPANENDAFIAEYFNTGQTAGDSTVDSIVYIYDCFYWNLVQIDGSSNVSVTVGWDTAYCMIYDTTYLRVTQWDGSRWADLGHGALSGFYSGTLVSSVPVTQNNYIAFGLSQPLIIPSLSLTTARSINNFFGLNCKDIFRDKCHDFQFVDDCDESDVDGLIEKVQGLYPGILRFNSGNPGNYFNWQKGWFFSDAHLYKYNQFLRDECHSFDIGGILFDPPFDEDDRDTYDVTLKEFKKALNYTGAIPLFQINISVSDIDFQISLLLEARRLNIPVSYVEFGAELYLPGSEGENVLTFKTGKEYGHKCYEWTRRIKDALGEDVQVSVCGARDDNQDLRRKNWNALMIKEFIAEETAHSTEPGPDAITLHQYIHKVSSPPASTALPYPFLNFDEMLCKPFREITTTSNGIKTINEIEMDEIRNLYPSKGYKFWITEYGLDENDWLVHGTWAAGLFTAAQTLAYLEIEDVTMATQFTLWANQVWGNIFVDDQAFLEPEDGDPESRHEYVFDVSNDIPSKINEYSALGHAMKHIGKAFKDSKYVRKINFSAQGAPLPVLCNYTVGDPPDPRSVPGLYGYYFSDEDAPPTSSTGKQIIILNLTSTSNLVPVSVLNNMGVPFNFTNYDISYAPDANPGAFVLGDNIPGTPNGDVECMIYNTTLQVYEVMATKLGDEVGIPISGNPITIPPYSIMRLYNCSIPLLTLTASAPNICLGQDVNLNIQSHAENTWEYLWSDASTLGYNVVTPTYNGTPPCGLSTSVYTVTVTDNTCGSTASASVSVNVRPAVDVTVTTGPTICPGSSSTLTATNTVDPICGFSDKYEWINSEEDGVGNTVSITVSPQATTTYTVYALYSFSSPDMQCAAMAEVTKEVVPLPGLPEDTIICNGDKIEINLTQYDGFNCAFTWTDGSTNTYADDPHFQQADPPFANNTPGIVNLTVTSSSPPCTLTAAMNVYPSKCCSGGNLTIDATYNSLDPNTDPKEPYLLSVINNLPSCPNCTAYWYSDKQQLEIDMSNLNAVVNGKWSPDFSVHLIGGDLGMSEGALIDMKPWFVLNLEGCVLHACTTNLWRGVFLHPAAGITTNLGPASLRPGITDAEYAINASNLSRVNLWVGDFDKNYLTLYVPPASDFDINYIISTNTNCNFTSTGSLLPPYYWHVGTTGDHPYAGMELHDVAFNAGLAGVNPSTYDNLNNGIIAINSALMVNNSTFKYLANYDNFTLPMTAFPGTGIYSGADFNHYGSLYQRGIGMTAHGWNPGLTFDHCVIGINSYHTGLNVADNTMDEVAVGILAQNTELTTMEINYNNIQASFLGLLLNNNSHGSIVNITQNVINTTTLSFGQQGIRIGEFANHGNVSLKQSFNLSCNVVTGDFQTGMQMTGLPNFTQVTSNTISTPSATMTRGMHFQNCNRTNINSNSVDFSGATAYLFNYGNELEIKNNLSAYTNIGFDFQGPNTNTKFITNSIGQHDVGLHLDEMGIIGTQFDASNPTVIVYNNLWTLETTASGHNSSYTSGWGAVNKNVSGTQSIDQSRFIVQSGTKGSTVNPWDDVSNFPGYPWFLTNLSAQTISSSYTDNCVVYIVEDEESLSRLDELIAWDSISCVNFEAEAKFITASDLFDKLEANEELRGSDSIFTAFYDNLEHTTLGELGKVRAGIQGIFNDDSDTLSEIALHDSLIHALLLQKSVIDTIINSGSSGVDSLSLISQTASLISGAVSHLNELNGLIEGLHNTRLSKIEDVSDLNESISPSTAIETNEQMFNEIYLDNIVINNYDLDTTYLATLHDIADQCPFTGGRSVYKARVILSQLNDSTVYDDETVCGAMLLLRKANPKKEKQNLYSIVIPNPAIDHCKVVYSLPKDKSGELEITDIRGSELFRQNISANSTEKLLNVSDFPGGIYFYTIKIDGERPMNGKLTVIK